MSILRKLVLSTMLERMAAPCRTFSTLCTLNGMSDSFQGSYASHISSLDLFPSTIVPLGVGVKKLLGA